MLENVNYRTNATVRRGEGFNDYADAEMRTVQFEWFLILFGYEMWLLRAVVLHKLEFSDIICLARILQVCLSNIIHADEQVRRCRPRLIDAENVSDVSDTSSSTQEVLTLPQKRRWVA